MSLKYDLSHIEDYQTMCYQPGGAMCAVTKALVFGALAVGLNELTEANLEEWRVRLAVLKRLRMPLGQWDNHGKLEDWWPTLADLRNHAGLKTNVLHEPREHWLKSKMEMLAAEAEYVVEADA